MLEIKKLELEKLKVHCAKEEMKLRVMEAEENIERLMFNIDNQEKRIIELDEKIKLLQGE